MAERSPQEAENDVNCAHLFARHGRRKVQGYWLRQKWWKCVNCGYESRSCNGIDRQMMRPVHPHMSVAVPGYNTVLPPERVDECSR